MGNRALDYVNRLSEPKNVCEFLVIPFACWARRLATNMRSHDRKWRIDHLQSVGLSKVKCIHVPKNSMQKWLPSADVQRDAKMDDVSILVKVNWEKQMIFASKARAFQSAENVFKSKFITLYCNINFTSGIVRFSVS